MLSMPKVQFLAPLQIHLWVMKVEKVKKLSPIACIYLQYKQDNGQGFLPTPSTIVDTGLQGEAANLLPPCKISENWPLRNASAT